MTTLVMKFGGTSVANVERIRNVARHVKREVDAGNKVAVVVSAMSGSTNQLVSWVREASLLHDAREYDAVVASGENVTAGLLAIVLQSMGVSARSFFRFRAPARAMAALEPQMTVMPDTMTASAAGIPIAKAPKRASARLSER